MPDLGGPLLYSVSKEESVAWFSHITLAYNFIDFDVSFPPIKFFLIQLRMIVRV